MQGIWVFGDSYAAPDHEIDWPFRVGQALNVPVHNYARAGSSTDYAIRTLFNQFRNIPDGDVVIFVASTVGRMHLEFQNKYPNTACWRDDAVWFGHPEEVGRYFTDNREHLRWYMTNVDLELEHIIHLGYKAVLKNFAESRSGLVIFLENSDLRGPQEITNLPNNFINPKIFLCPISENEIINRPSYNEWTQWAIYDPRVNHLTEPNLKILVRLIVNVILNPTITNVNAFQYNQFLKDIIKVITNREERNYYIQNGILHPGRHVPGFDG